jgi:hypothetical protein
MPEPTPSAAVLQDLLRQPHLSEPTVRPGPRQCRPHRPKRGKGLESAVVAREMELAQTVVCSRACRHRSAQRSLAVAAHIPSTSVPARERRDRSCKRGTSGWPPCPRQAAIRPYTSDFDDRHPTRQGTDRC